MYNLIHEFLYYEYDFDGKICDLEWFCFDSEWNAIISEWLYADLEYSYLIAYDKDYNID